jgi:L-malate glycosyltransferase
MKVKKKILMIDLGKSYGGAEKLIENIMLGLEDDFDISIAIDRAGEFRSKSEPLKIFKTLLLNNNLKNLIKNIFIIRKYVKKEKIDTIHCHGIPSNIIGIILKKTCRIKFITTIHSDLLYEFQGKKKFIYSKIEKLTLKYADFIIPVSNNLKEKLTNRHGKEDEKIKLIYNGIDIDTSKVRIKERDEKFKILFVGRLVEIKNVELLLKGLNYIKNKGKDFECNIIGDGEELEKLKKITNDLELDSKVRFLGYRNDIQEFMNKSNVLILTSKMEGIPITIIEAFANKLPVISTSVGGVLEMIVNGETGVLFDLENKDEFNRVLLDLVENKYNLDKLSNNAYNEYLGKWNQKTLTDKYKDIYLK